MAISAHGTILRIRDGDDYIVIAEVLDISGPGQGLEVATVTPANPDEIPAVLPDSVSLGEISFDINYTGVASQAIIRDAYASRVPQDFQIEFPIEPSEVSEFSGLVTSFDYSAPVDGVLRSGITVALTSRMLAV